MGTHSVFGPRGVGLPPADGVVAWSRRRMSVREWLGMRRVLRVQRRRGREIVARESGVTALVDLLYRPDGSER